MAEQHVVSEWLLRAFAGRGPEGTTLALFDKATGLHDVATANTFMTETDVHSIEIEDGIEGIETPAAAAARRLAKRVRNLPPGLYAVVSEGANVRTGGPGVSDKGVRGGMRLLVSDHQVPSPSADDRRVLGRYAGLMYQRAPKNEAAIMRLGTDYDAAAQQALNRLLPGMKTGLETVLARRRSRMLGLAARIGEGLAAARWWVVRAAKGDAFVLSDTPVAAALSLGHDDTWRAILSDDAYAVVMPLGPTIALVMAPQGFMPITDIDLDLAGVTRAINRLMWRHADRYVLARHRSELDGAWPEANDEQRRASVEAAVATERVVASAWRDVTSIAIDVLWRHQNERWLHWTGCRLEFGWQPFDSEDRNLVRRPFHP
jgi:hypothetical protein